MIPRLSSHAVARPRLSTAFDAAASITIVQGPTGFGKTTLVTQWLTQPGSAEHAVWVDAPAAGGDALWGELVAAMQAAGIVDTTSIASPAALARHLGSRPVIVVVDALDRVSDESAEQSLLDMVRRSAGTRLIVCTRRSPSLLARSRIELDQVLLTGRDLAFTTEETRALLRTVAPTVALEHAGAVQEQTGGWPTLVRAVAQALAEQPRRTVTDTAVDVSSEFLRTSLLPYLRDDALARFVLATSVFEDITPGAAEVVTDDGLSKIHLQRLESAGVLHAELSDVGVRYRWPAAARHALYRQLSRQEPDRILELHDRIAVWHRDAHRPAAALRHAVQARNWPLTVALIEANWGVLYVDHLETIDPAMAQLPRDYIAASARVVAMRDIRLRLRNEPGDDLLLQIPPPLPSQPDELDPIASSPAAFDALDTASAMMIAFRSRGLFTRARTYADIGQRVGDVARVTRPADVKHRLPSKRLQIGITQMLADDAHHAEASLWQAYETAHDGTFGHVAPDAAGKLALHYALRGDIALAGRWLQRHEASDGTPSDWLVPFVAESGVHARALVAIERLDHEAAALAVGLELRADTEQCWNTVVSYVRARYALLCGDRHGAVTQLRHDRSYLAAWLEPGSTMRPLLDATEADLLTALGLGQQAHYLITTAPPHPALEVPRARLALLTGDLDTAARLAVIELGKPTTTRRAQAELLLIRAAAQRRSGDLDAAAETVRDAVASIEATGSLAAFSSISRADLTALLELLPAQHAVVDPSTMPDVFPETITVLALTEREHLVLHHIAEGKSIRQIATTLYVSYNTVKTQIRSLYQKLGAGSREEVIGIARQQGLIADHE